MMVDLPAGRRGQVLALALTLTVLAALWVGAVAPVIDWFNERADQLEHRQALLARMQTLANALPTLRQQGAPATNGPGATGAVLDDPTDAVAGATLQGAVQHMAGAAGASLASAATLAPEATSGGWRRIGVRVTLRASWPVLAHLLQSIEQATPRMLIDDLQLHANAAGPQSSPEQIDASLAVYAFRSVTPSKPAARGDAP
jgi:general secretion pathway protein M